MHMANGKLRQRAWKPKGRTGCKTCKIRRVKCDEAKPHCKRCISTGRPCDGYDPAFTPSPSSTSSPLVETSGYLAEYGDVILRSYLPPSLVPSLRLKTRREYESLDFFIKHASISLGGIVASSFWHQDVLRAAYWHSPIRHGIIALGAMYRRFFQGSSSSLVCNDSDEHLRFALQQCNQVIRALTETRSLEIYSLDKITVMTCAVLFGSMSCLQGHQGAALQHIRSGIRIMHELDRGQDAGLAEHPIGLESLRSVLISLDLQARSILSREETRDWEPVIRSTHWLPSASAEQRIPSSPLIVHQYFEALLDKILASTHHDRQILLSSFAAGTTMLQILCAHHTSKTELSQPIQLIQLLHCVAEYFLRSPRVECQCALTFTYSQQPTTPFDAPTHFTKMIDLAATLLVRNGNASPVYAPISGPMFALWLVVTHAPGSCVTLRRRAVQLMQRYPRREGMYDGFLAGQISSDILAWEQERTRAELGLDADAGAEDLVVPDHLRLLAFRALYVADDQRRAKLEYTSARALTRGEQRMERWIVW